MATNVGSMALAIAVIGLVLGAGSYVYAGQATSSALNSLKSNELGQAQTDISKAKSELSDLRSEVTKAKSDLKKVDNEQEDTEVAVKQAKDELGKVTTDLAQTKSQLATTRADLQKAIADLQKVTSDTQKTASDLQKTIADMDKTKTDLQKTISDLDKTRTDLARTSNLALSSYLRILIDKVVGEMIEVKGTLDTPGSNITRRVGTVRGPILGTFRDAPWPATMKPAADKAVEASNKLIGALNAGNRAEANKAFQDILDVLDGDLFRAFRTWAREAGILAPRLEFPELFGED